MFFRKPRVPSQATPQTQPLDARQIRNDAGGYVYEVERWNALVRFLVIGTEGGTFYAGQAQMTDRAEHLIDECLREDGPRVVATAREISQAGRAVKQDYAIFALALALSSADIQTRRAAYDALANICRTASTLFQLLSYLDGRRGWSRGLRRAVARWYETETVASRAYQFVKYRERNGYTHRDVLRLAHPVTREAERQALFAWAVEKPYDIDALPLVVRDLIAAREATSVDLELIARLPREALPTQWLNEPDVWKALLASGMPLTALLRNLGNLSKHGVLTAGSPEAELVNARLGDRDAIRASRSHPMAVLLAQTAYASGSGSKGSGSWAPVGSVVDALDQAFALAFENVEPTGKKLLVAVDVSGSMRGARVAGTALSAAEVSSAMAYVIARVEPNSDVIGFDYTGFAHEKWYAPKQSGIYPVKIAADERLRDFQARFTFGGGGTDCALPFVHAMESDYDAIVVLTDSETWAGNEHAERTLEKLRAKATRPVRAVCAATTATRGSIVATEDRLALQIAGFDASAPAVISEFLRT